jgi:hypothetical protein
MNTCITQCLESTVPGPAQTYRQITVFPLMGKNGAGVRYLTTSEAFHTGVIRVSEVDAGGSVPELMVANTGSEPVLILDGEELMGAKQNRVLNTSVLVPAKSELVVPVSCTEAGRWDYTSPAFSDSGVVMSRKARAHKSGSVSHSLESSGEYTSDQGEVWDEVAALHAKLGTASPTGSMKDAYLAKETDIDSALAAFEVQPGQRGILVAVNGQVLGLDLFSNDDVYGKVHVRLLKSYIIDSLFEDVKPGKEPSDASSAKTFLATAARCEEKVFASIGMGNDHRLHGDGLRGSALVHADEVVHAAFFRNENERDDPSVAGFRTRRRYRR